MTMATLPRDLGDSDLDAKLSPNVIRQISALRKVLGIEAARNLLVAARESVRRAIEAESLRESS